MRPTSGMLVAAGAASLMPVSSNGDCASAAAVAADRAQGGHHVGQEDLQRPRTVRIALDVAEALECAQLVSDRRGAGQADRRTDLAHAGRVAALLDLVAQELQHLALARGEARGVCWAVGQLGDVGVAIFAHGQSLAPNPVRVQTYVRWRVVAFGPSLRPVPKTLRGSRESQDGRRDRSGAGDRPRDRRRAGRPRVPGAGDRPGRSRCRGRPPPRSAPGSASRWTSPTPPPTGTSPGRPGRSHRWGRGSATPASAFDGDLAALSDEQVRLMVEVNLLGVMWGVRAAADAFRRPSRRRRRRRRDRHPGLAQRARAGAGPERVRRDQGRRPVVGDLASHRSCGRPRSASTRSARTASRPRWWTASTPTAVRGQRSPPG